MGLFQKEDKSARSVTPDSERDMESPAVVPPAASPVHQPAAASSRDFQAHLGQGSRVEGRLSFEGSVRIDGHVEGEITAQETVLIGESAVVAAQIDADSVVVLGGVTGDITAKKRIELRAPAKVLGNLTTPGLVIHEGVTFEGHCSMSGAESRSGRENKVTFLPTEERGAKEERGKVSKISSETGN